MMELELIKTNLKRYTFENIKIKNWVEQNSYGLVLNLFAGKTKLNLNEIRNDLDPQMLADFHKDALSFILEYDGPLFDTIICDPPYSYRKSMEMYNGNLNSRFKLVADNLVKIVNPMAKIISFGYHSTFLGEKRGYDLIKMCIFAHGGAQHCTIAIIEQKNHNINLNNIFEDDNEEEIDNYKINKNIKDPTIKAKKALESLSPEQIALITKRFQGLS